MASYEKFIQIGMALDPIHVGTGGARIGRVDLTIVRDPVTQVPKIPGSSLAGVYRTYVAMHYEDNASSKFNRQASPDNSFRGDRNPITPTAPGWVWIRTAATAASPIAPSAPSSASPAARAKRAVLPAWPPSPTLTCCSSPCPPAEGPMWVTCPMVLHLVGLEVNGVEDDAVYLQSGSNNQTNNQTNNQINLGWLLLPVKTCAQMNTITESTSKFVHLLITSATAWPWCPTASLPTSSTATWRCAPPFLSTRPPAQPRKERCSLTKPCRGAPCWCGRSSPRTRRISTSTKNLLR
ncbi:MAG: hypothetical protein KatS3mg052_0489 [Candidatus Roseilinea sp.]|nr:MAG: hypothetical protein KatS3mg052_0489 [Candidatus Roseilinea sp.]